MWGKPPFTIADNSAVDVKNLNAAARWYKEKLKLREGRGREEDDSGRPFVDLCDSKNGPFLSLIELSSGDEPEKRHVIFFCKHLEEAHEWFVGQGITVDPISQDSGGNSLFRFYDVEGNAIEVCVEP